MRVNIPGPLRSYTANAGAVEGAGSCVAELLADLDRRYPGIRFRMIDEQDGIRQHIKIFVNGELVRDLAVPVAPQDEVHIICAISGGRGQLSAISYQLSAFSFCRSPVSMRFTSVARGANFS